MLAKLSRSEKFKLKKDERIFIHHKNRFTPALICDIVDEDIFIIIRERIYHSTINELEIWI